MEVISLVGASGTGKSYRALIVAKANSIDYIIDDGLLIKGNKIIAGASAKKEHTKVAAVRRALFMDPQHRKEVVQSLEAHSPDKILILGTSDKMVDKISKTLEIGAAQNRIYIKDIASEEEIELACRQRFKEGKHVIPVPTLEVKKDFSGYFLDTLKILTKKRDNSVTVDEKTVVRPTYSYMGKYTIYGRAIVQITRAAAENIEGLHKIFNVDIAVYPHGIVVNIDASLVYGLVIRDVVAPLKKAVKYEIESMTSLNVLAINVVVKSLAIEGSSF
jgi:uncharacterized alkaline shock family protein YloU